MPRQDVDAFQKAEMDHYRSDIKNPDVKYVEHLFRNLQTTTTPFPSSEQLYSKQVKGFQCPFCGDTNASIKHNQKRAADEPGRFEYQCRSNPTHTWVTN